MSPMYGSIGSASTGSESIASRFSSALAATGAEYPISLASALRSGVTYETDY